MQLGHREVGLGTHRAKCQRLLRENLLHLLPAVHRFEFDLQQPEPLLEVPLALQEIGTEFETVTCRGEAVDAAEPIEIILCILEAKGILHLGSISNADAAHCRRVEPPAEPLRGTQRGPAAAPPPQSTHRAHSSVSSRASS